jgi:plasmid stabilization system protein ParE
MKTVDVTRAAREDLFNIWEFIAADSTEAADRVLDALERALGQLGRNPGIGHLREDLAGRDHRFYCVYSYLIVFRLEDDILRVVRVVHAARDVRLLLGLATEDS